MSAAATRAIYSTFAISMLAGLVMAGISAPASAKTILSCDGSGRRAVIECCEAIVERKGMPMWMRQAGRNCSSSVRCVPGGNGSSQSPRSHAVAPPKRCFVVMLNPADRGSGDNRTPDQGK